MNAICRELELRKLEITGEIETIYLGGGTPSLLEDRELDQIFQTIYTLFPVSENAEVTLEANPDDLSEEKIKTFSAHAINRLSIGVQSFQEKDLKLMNRAHNESEAWNSIQIAKKFFDNLSIDLIYGIPGMSNEDWMKNLRTAIDLGVPHISSYALTVEPKTALKVMIEKGKINPVEEDLARAHYDIMRIFLREAGYENYEFSNFGKPGYFSRNNTAYWFGKPYLGIGPSAHSYDGKIRKWNLSNNSLYIKALERNDLPFEQEELSVVDRYNEYVMTRLRTMWGISVSQVEKEFGASLKEFMIKEAEELITKDLLKKEGDNLLVSERGKFLSDGIAAELFFLSSESPG